MFVGAQNGTVYSLDAKTGCTYWTFKTQSAIRAATTIGPRRTASGEREHTLYVADQSAHVYALDAQTGDLLWAHKVDDLPGARVTGAPTLYQDRLYVPVASGRRSDGAQSRRIPAASSAAASSSSTSTATWSWKTFTLPENAKPLGKTRAGTQRWGPSGAGIWSAPTIDVAQESWCTSRPATCTPSRSRSTSDAVIAMDLDTGKIRWSVAAARRRTCGSSAVRRPGNNCAANAADIGPDYDLGDSPMLAKLPNGKDAIVVGQKSGQGWALDPDKKGAVLWEYRAGRGDTLGGIEWGPAVDAQNAYFAVSDFRLENPGGLHAVNLSTGQRAWLTPAPPPACSGPAPNCSGAQSAAITVIPGVVFSGSVDGALRALFDDRRDDRLDVRREPRVPDRERRQRQRRLVRRRRARRSSAACCSPTPATARSAAGRAMCCSRSGWSRCDRVRRSTRSSKHAETQSSRRALRAPR